MAHSNLPQPPAMKTLAERLRFTRMHYGLSQEEISILAERKVTAQTISNWERGLRHPRSGSRQLRAAAEALDVTPLWLLTGYDTPAFVLRWHQQWQETQIWMRGG